MAAVGVLMAAVEAGVRTAAVAAEARTVAEEAEAGLTAAEVRTEAALTDAKRFQLQPAPMFLGRVFF
jgi:hypothetical protein